MVKRQGEILHNEVVAKGLLDCLIPLSGSDGKITGIDDGGNVTVEFSAPIQSYLDLLTKKKLSMILELMDDFKEG